MGLPNADNDDARKPYEWKSKYSFEAQCQIYFEVGYLLTVVLVCLSGLLFIWIKMPFTILSMSNDQYRSLVKFGLTGLGGIFGGTLFDIKWLIHAVAKGKWHCDRRLWRLLVPIISGGFALSFVMLMSAFIKIFDVKGLESPPAAFGFGFLVGYFSDSAIAKLSEVAKNLFGNLEPGEDKKLKARAAKQDLTKPSEVDEAQPANSESK